MKRTHLFKLAFICSFAIFMLASCSNGATYWIDNPTNNEITVTIDGKEEIKVAANEFKKMEKTLKLGEHTMKVNDAEVKFNLDKDHVILNPTLSTYVIVLQEYGTGFASTENDTVITLDGEEYEGPFPTVTADPFIYSGDLNFLVDTPFKGTIETSKTGTVIMRKIFRKTDFIKFYQEEYE